MTIMHEELFQNVLPVLQSKLEEFQYYGYNAITLEDLWSFCIQKKWRKKNIDDLKVYEIVETIYSIKASEIVSHSQIQQFKQTDWFSDGNQQELSELLKK